MNTRLPVLSFSRRSLAALCGLLALAGSALAEDAAQPASAGLLVVTNKADRTLSIIDPVAMRQISAVPEDGVTGHEVAASADGALVFVPIFGNSGVGKPGTDGTLIRVIDLKKRAIVGTIDYGKGVRPHCPILCAKSGLLYVTTELENSVSIVDPRTWKVIGSIPTGKPESHMLAVSHDGKRGYTANVESGTVSVLDLENRKLDTIIPVTQITQRISVSVDDKLAFTSDQITPRLAVIDTAEKKVKQWVELPDIGYGTAPTPDGKSLIVALVNRNELAEVSLETMKVTRTLPLPKSPQAVVIRPDGAVAYISCDASAKVAAVDLKTWKVLSLIDAGKGADGLAWAATTP